MEFPYTFPTEFRACEVRADTKRQSLSTMIDTRMAPQDGDGELRIYIQDQPTIFLAGQSFRHMLNSSCMSLVRNYFDVESRPSYNDILSTPGSQIPP